MVFPSLSSFLVPVRWVLLTWVTCSRRYKCQLALAHLGHLVTWLLFYSNVFQCGCSISSYSSSRGVDSSLDRFVLHCLKVKWVKWGVFSSLISATTASRLFPPEHLLMDLKHISSSKRLKRNLKRYVTSLHFFKKHLKGQFNFLFQLYFVLRGWNSAFNSLLKSLSCLLRFHIS